MANTNPRTKTKTHFDRDQLIELIFLDMVAGVSRYQIKLKLQNDAYDVPFKTSKLGKSSHYNYLTEAFRLCKVELGEKHDEMRALHIAQLNDLYAESRDQGDRMTALNTLKELAKLQGFEPPKKVEADVSVSGTITVDFGLDGDED